MNIRSIYVLFTYIFIFSKSFFLAAYPITRPKVPLFSTFACIVLLLYSVSMLIYDKKSRVRLNKFIIFFWSEIIVVSSNIFLCVRQGITHLTFWQQGIVGSIWDILIDLLLITLVVRSSAQNL